nr:MAG TPA: hypothetical protein [Microviridae sp.]
MHNSINCFQQNYINQLNSQSKKRPRFYINTLKSFPTSIFNRFLKC